MTTESIPVQQELEEELYNLVITTAQSSATEYYHKWKRDSYPLNLDSDKRARAIMFTMTRRRPGWEHDVRSLYKMLKSFSVDVERVYDPDYNQILTSLKAFVENEENHLIDMCFVIFMGHGCTTINNQHDVNLEIEGGFFNIWSESVNIFRKETSLLRNKPKVFIVQSCRNVSPWMEDSGTISLYSPSSFTDYKFVYASQPGMVADREHHFFIDTLTSLVTREAHRNHLCDLINKKLLLEFKKNKKDPGVKAQMPQICESLPKLLNTFPGITKDYLDAEYQNVKISQQECGGYTDYIAQVALPSINTIKARNPRTNPVVDNNNEQKAMDPNANSHQSKGDKSLLEHNKLNKKLEKLDNTGYEKGKTGEKKTDDKKDKVNNTDCQVILKIETTVQPESNYQKTQQVLFDHLKSEEQRKQMETFLSTECETPVIIDGITLGSIIIHITCDVKALEPLQFLSETDLLSSKFTNLFVTEEFLEKCNVCQVTLDVKLTILDEQILKTLTPMIYTLPFTLSFLGKTFIIKAPVQTSGKVQWFHNDVPITDCNRINLYTEEYKACFVKVTDACVADTGVYSCKYTSADGFPVLMRGQVLVMNQSAPSNVKTVAKTSDESRIDVSWDPAIGDITGYSIVYSHSLDGGSPETLSTNVVTKAAITDVLPGETYNMSVCSVSEEGVSDPEPPGGITVHTPPETPVGHLIPVPYVLGLYRVTWEKPRKDGVYVEATLSNNVYVIPSETDELHIQLLNKPKITLYLTGERMLSCRISSFYKGFLSKKVDLKTIIECQLYTSLPGLVIQESKEEYYDSIKDESYPVSLQTVRRGRAVVFITGGNEMQYRTDLDLLRLLAALSIQFWLIYDPDVDTIDYYLSECVQRKKHDKIDYCLVFFIGSRFGAGIDTCFVTGKMESFNIFEKISDLHIQWKIIYDRTVPTFVFNFNSLACKTGKKSSKAHIISPTSKDPACSDTFFLYTNTKDESNKWYFLKFWVDNVVDKCHHLSLEAITEGVVHYFAHASKKPRPQIISTLTKKLNLFPSSSSLNAESSSFNFKSESERESTSSSFRFKSRSNRESTSATYRFKSGSDIDSESVSSGDSGLADRWI